VAGEAAVDPHGDGEKSQAPAGRRDLAAVRPLEARPARRELRIAIEPVRRRPHGLRAFEDFTVDVGDDDFVPRRDVALEEHLEHAPHVGAEGPPRLRVAAAREQPELRDLLRELVVDALLEPDEEHLPRDEHRRDDRDREQPDVRGEDARAEAEP